jgi:hypothetical protein
MPGLPASAAIGSKAVNDGAESTALMRTLSLAPIGRLVADYRSN